MCACYAPSDSRVAAAPDRGALAASSAPVAAAAPSASTSDAAIDAPAAVAPAASRSDPRWQEHGLPGIPLELEGEARERFVRALDGFRAGNARWAYATAKPLFDLYPDVYEVQDLRCQLAAIRWLAPQELTAECAPLKRLSAAWADAGKAHPGVSVEWK
jgi:hypothetical protein